MAQRIRKLYVNSSARVSGSPSSFRWESPVDLSAEGTVHCAITSVVLPHIWYGIQTGVNDKFYIRQVASSSVNSIMTVPAGNYSASALAAKLAQLLAGVALSSHSYSCSYSSVTQKITITSVGSFLVYSDAVLRQQGMIGSTNLISPQSINQVLNSPTQDTASTSWTSGIINLARIHEVYIRSSTLANSSTLDSNGRYDTLRRVPITCAYGELQVTDSSFEASDLMNISGRTISSINIQLTDSAGSQIDMQDMDWSFAISLVYGDID
jgi:hypothetical protein